MPLGILNESSGRANTTVFREESPLNAVFCCAMGIHQSFAFLRGNFRCFPFPTDLWRCLCCWPCFPIAWVCFWVLSSLVSARIASHMTELLLLTKCVRIWYGELVWPAPHSAYFFSKVTFSPIEFQNNTLTFRKTLFYLGSGSLINWFQENWQLVDTAISTPGAQNTSVLVSGFLL